MVDTVTSTTMGNDNDDWEVAVDTGEFDKRHEQQEKARAANQESVVSALPSTVNDDDSRGSSNLNFINSNKPIRILKRPTSQSQLLTNNDVTSSSISTTTTIATASTTVAAANNNTNNSNSPSANSISSSTTVPVVSIIPRNQTKDPTNVSQSTITPVFSSISSSSQSTKPAIKTYEQRELEYRLARLRIMGEEESSAKDDDDDIPVVESATSIPVDDTTKSTTSSISSTTRTTSKMSGLSQPPLQCQSTPGSYTSNLYTLNNVPSNTGAIHFTPHNNNNNNNSTSNLGTGPFSSPNFPQHYRGTYSAPYSHMPPPPSIPRYPLTATTTTTLYMTSTAPFVSAPSSSSSSVSSSYQYPPPQQHPNMTTNNWYHYQHPQAPYGAHQYGHPQ